MKRTLLPLSLAMLLGASLQAQAADVDYVQIPSETSTTSNDFFHADYNYSSSQSLVPASYFAEYTDGLTFNSIGVAVSNVPTKTNDAGSITVTISLAETDRTEGYIASTSTNKAEVIESLVPASEFKQVYQGELLSEEINGQLMANFPLNEAFTLSAGKSLVVNVEVTVSSWMHYSNADMKVKGITPADGARYMVYAADDNSEAGASIYSYSSGGSKAFMPAFTFGVGEAEAPVQNAFNMNFDYNTARATRLSATEGEISIAYNITEEQNVDYYHFFVVRAPREGEAGDQVLGTQDIKAGAKGDVTIPLTLDEDGEFTTYVKCYAVYNDEKESQTYETGAVYVPAWVANAFEVEFTHAHAIRISATEAEVSVTYNVTKEQNVVGYQFKVVDAEGSVLGSSEVKAGSKSEETIELTLPEGNNDAIPAVIKMNAVYEDGTTSEVTTYDVTVPEYIDNPNGVDFVSAENGEAVYYNLQGARVANPENGLYIRVLNGKAAKVMVK